MQQTYTENNGIIQREAKKGQNVRKVAREKLTPEVRKARHQWLLALIAKRTDGDLQAFSSRVEIDRSTISLLYHNHREVTDKYAIRIANRLKVDPPDDMALQGVAIEQPVTKAAEPAPQYGATVPRVDYDRVVGLLDRQMNLFQGVLDRMDVLAEEVRALRSERAASTQKR